MKKYKYIIRTYEKVIEEDTYGGEVSTEDDLTENEIESAIFDNFETKNENHFKNFEEVKYEIEEFEEILYTDEDYRNDMEKRGQRRLFG